MRPIQLTMSAFGSYADEVCISFEEHNHGIFLITGDTGAGKTTIFDAISYALYDRTSGGLRDGNMMRSHFASEETQTFVELIFLYQGQKYQIRRNPSYERLKKKKNTEGKYDTTKQNASVSLILPDGSEYTGTNKNINDKIIDIMGIDGNQFTQIAMIAQGDFLRLLHAESDKRKEIFSRIFDTKIYAAIQRELKERSKAIGEQLSMNKTLCSQELAGVLCLENSRYAVEWEEKRQFSEVAPRQSLIVLEQILEELKSKEEQIQGEIQGIKIKLDLIKSRISSGKQMNELLKRLELLKKEAQELTIKKESIEKLEKSKEWAKKALKVQRKEEVYIKSKGERDRLELQIKNLELEQKKFSEELVKLEVLNKEQESKLQKSQEEEGKKILQLEASLEKYEIADGLEKEYQKHRKDWMALEKELKVLEERMAAFSLEEKKLEEEELINQGIGERYLQCKQEVEKCEEKEKVFLSVLELTKKGEKLKKELEKKHLVWKKKEEEYQKAKNDYEEKSMAFFNEQAGILAQELEEGSPCPVCGSQHHPNKARVQNVAYSQEQVEIVKKRRDLLFDEAKKTEGLYQKEKEDYQLLFRSIEMESRLVMGEEFSFDWNKIAELEEGEKRNAFEAKKKREEADQIDQKKIKSEENRKRLVELKQMLQEDGKKKESFQSQKNDIRTEAEGKKERLKEIKNELPEANKKEAQDKIIKYRKLLEQAKKEAETAQLHLKELLQKKNTNEGSLQLSQQNLKNKVEECLQARGSFEQEIQGQGFMDELDYKNWVQSEDAIEEMEEEIKSYHQKMSEVQIQIGNYLEQTKDSKPVDLESLAREESIELNKLEGLEKEEKQVYSLLQNNQKVYQNLEKRFAEREKLVVAFEQVSRLDKTANGTLPGSQKIDFQTYVQRLYFQHIIIEANKRLHVMSGEQFVLKRRELEDSSKQGKSGLDLDVLNLITNKSRDVKTLSGGESFMASLCMALGMSDVIQNTAGRVHLDTMFIDEGFGSLDEESREQAIRILNGLAEGKRLVGIISHVTELKERIPLKLMVSKDEKGSRICWQDEQ